MLAVVLELIVFFVVATPTYVPLYFPLLSVTSVGIVKFVLLVSAALVVHLIY